MSNVSVAVALVAAAVSMPSVALGRPTTAKSKPAAPTTRDSPATKAKQKRKAAKSALRSVKMKKILQATATTPTTIQGTLPEPEPPAPNPFADMPAAPIAEAVGVTEDRFVLGPRQTYTPHGSLRAEAEVEGDWGIINLAGDGYLRLYVNFSWASGHDLTIECWGVFPTGPIEILANNGGSEELGKVVADPPAGNKGRIKVAVPSADFALEGYFNIQFRDADGVGERWSIYQCSVQRD